MDRTVITAVIITACSFILQKTLGNLLYGVIIFISRPFKKGDKISIQQSGREIASGKLVKRTPLHIYVKDYGRDVHIIPNSLLESCTVVNSDYKEGVNYTNYIKVSFDSNVQKVREIIEECVILDEETLNTKDNTHVILKTEDSGLVLEYNVRTENVDQSFDVCSRVKEEIILKLQDYEDIVMV